MAVYYGKNCSSGAVASLADSSSIQDLLNASRVQWLALVEKYSDFLTDELKSFLINEIERLSELGDWKDDDIPINLASAQAFMKLLINLKPEVFPGLSCDYEGRVVMYRRRGHDIARFKCFSRNWVRWIVSIHEGDKKIKLSGKGTVSNISKHVKSLKIFYEMLLAK